MPKKKRKLPKNFYFGTSGSIEFRQMIRGELITGRTGCYDVDTLWSRQTEIRHKVISDHFQFSQPIQEKTKKVTKQQLNKYFKEWLKELSNSNNQKTINTYKSNVKSYLEFGIPIYKRSRKKPFLHTKEKVSMSYKNAVRRDYNIFSRWCIEKYGCDLKLEKGKTESEPRLRVLNKNEFDRILDCTPNKDLRDCFKFIYYTGARRKEANRPKKEWLRQNNKGDYYLQVVKKGNYKRIIRVNQQALAILKERNFDFWNFTLDRITRDFKLYSVTANVEGVILHDLRRTFGYNCLVENKMDISIVARLLGISIKVADRHYTPLCTSNIADFNL